MIFFWAAEVYGEGIAGCRRGRLEMWASVGGRRRVSFREMGKRRWGSVRTGRQAFELWWGRFLWEWWSGGRHCWDAT